MIAARSNSGSFKSLKFIGIVLLGASMARTNAKPVIRFADDGANFFPSTVVTTAVHVISRTPARGRLIWSFGADGAVLARGEAEINLAAPGLAEIPVSFAVPEARPDASITAGLRVSLAIDGEDGIITSEKPMWILGPEPWLGRLKWIEQLNIMLFDPDETTAPILEKAGIPFTPVHNPDALANGGRQGLLLIAEGIDFQDFRGLPDTIMTAASSGMPVLCLAPIEGEMNLPGLTEPGQGQRSISFADTTIIHQIDKRLDMKTRTEDGGTIKSTIHVRAERDRVLAIIEPNTDGWPWLELVFPAKSARMILTGFEIMGRWEETPAARHMFMRLLERVEPKNQEVKR